MTLTGSSTFNAAAVYGRLKLRGKGTLIVNGARGRWNGPVINLGKVPKDVKKLFQFALTGAPPPLRAGAADGTDDRARHVVSTTGIRQLIRARCAALRR